METVDLLKKVRTIEIKTRGLSKHIFAGEYHSAFKGRGMAFCEVREYQAGDDIRSIDWNVTARFNHPYVKIFEEERELTVMIMVDVSGSQIFGTTNQLKQSLITEVAAVLSFSAIQNNDKIGLILFSDKIEKFIPAKKGKKHILRIIRELIDFQPTSKGTDVSNVLRYFSNVTKKRSTAFLISDFIAPDFSKALRVAKYKHDLIALRILDKRETELPNIGLVKMKDAETQQDMWVDTSNRKVREFYAKNSQTTENQLKDMFMRCGVDYTTLETGTDYVKPLLQLFKKR